MSPEAFLVVMGMAWLGLVLIAGLRAAGRTHARLRRRLREQARKEQDAESLYHAWEDVNRDRSSR